MAALILGPGIVPALGDDPNAPPKQKKPALYRAGATVGAGLSAAHDIASNVDQTARNAIQTGANAVSQGIGEFSAGLHGQPVPSAAPAPAPAGSSFDRWLAAQRPSSNVMMLHQAPTAAPQLTAPAATAPVDAASTPGVDSGVTLPGGRTLPYGSMVDGVPTFSDGTNGIARTMTNADVQNLGKSLNVVPASAFTRAAPAFNSDNSDANVAALIRSRQGSKFGISPEMNAQADLASTLNRDPRSTLGRAALNLSRSANAASTTLQRKAALDSLQGIDSGVVRNYLDTTAGQSQLANTQAAGANALQRQSLANQGDLARQGLANEGDLARTDLAGQYDVAGRIAQGQARTTLSEKDLNAGAIKLLPQVLGLNAAGMVDDPSVKGGMRAPTDTEIAAAMQRAKSIIQGQIGASSGSGAPYAEGTRLRGPDGKTYVVKNGVPVVQP